MKAVCAPVLTIQTFHWAVHYTNNWWVAGGGALGVHDNTATWIELIHAGLLKAGIGPWASHLISLPLLNFSINQMLKTSF